MVFPVAAPHLNPQERVWKEPRRAVSHDHMQARLPDLADQFEQHLSTTTFESWFLSVTGLHRFLPDAYLIFLLVTRQVQRGQSIWAARAHSQAVLEPQLSGPSPGLDRATLLRTVLPLPYA